MPRPAPPAATDVLCEQCGYTLNGLPPSAACPECGSPVADSTVASARRAPRWEAGGRGAAGTIGFVLFAPRMFFRSLDARPSNRKSRAFSILFLGIASFFALQTVTLHYLLVSGIGAAPPWLPAMWLTIPLLLIGIVATMFAGLELASWLAAVEGRWWGYRMSTPVVRRAMQYLTPHVAVAVNLPYAVIVVFLILLSQDEGYERWGPYLTHYLFALSGAVVVAAVYVFRIFMYAMRGIAYANPPGSDPLARATLNIDPPPGVITSVSMTSTVKGTGTSAPHTSN